MVSKKNGFIQVKYYLISLNKHKYMNLYQQNNNIWFNQVEMGVKLQVTAFTV